MINVEFNKIKKGFEDGTLKEENMTSEEKQMLIDWYKKSCEYLIEKIKKEKSNLYKVYVNMKK